MSFRAALLALIALASCVQRQWAGDFAYICTRPFHPLDGWSCEAELNEHFLLRIWDTSEAPTLQYRIRPGEDQNAGAIDPPRGEDTPHIARAGLNDDVLVVETTESRWYLHRLGTRAPGMNWPLMEGPFTRAEFEARTQGLNLPPMRQTR